MPRQGNDSKEAVVARFDAAAKIFEVFCPKGIIRLPSPRERFGETFVAVEMDLASFETLMAEMKNPAVAPEPTQELARLDDRRFPNLRLMLARGLFYSRESADAEIATILDFIDGKP